MSNRKSSANFNDGNVILFFNLDDHTVAFYLATDQKDEKGDGSP